MYYCAKDHSSAEPALLKKEKRHICLLLLPMSITALVGMVGVAFVVPFIMVAADPASISQHQKLMWLYQTLHFQSSQQFLIFLGVIVYLLNFGELLTALNTWLNVRVTSKINAALSYRFLKYYLSKPYVFFSSS